MAFVKIKYIGAKFFVSKPGGELKVTKKGRKKIKLSDKIISDNYHPHIDKITTYFNNIKFTPKAEFYVTASGGIYYIDTNGEDVDFYPSNFFVDSRPKNIDIEEISPDMEFGILCKSTGIDGGDLIDYITVESGDQKYTISNPWIDRSNKKSRNYRIAHDRLLLSVDPANLMYFDNLMICDDPYVGVCCKIAHDYISSNKDSMELGINLVSPVEDYKSKLKLINKASEELFDSPEKFDVLRMVIDVFRRPYTEDNPNPVVMEKHKLISEAIEAISSIGAENLDINPLKYWSDT